MASLPSGFPRLYSWGLAAGSLWRQPLGSPWVTPVPMLSEPCWREMGQALAVAPSVFSFGPLASGTGQWCARAGRGAGPRGWHGTGLGCQRGEWRRREEGTMPGAWVWQLPPEETQGCPRMSWRLVTCQGWVNWERNLGNSEEGQGARPGPFAEAGTDPQGSLRRSQPQPAGSGSPVVPPHGSRRGSGGHGGAWRRAPETAVPDGAQAFSDHRRKARR